MLPLDDRFAARFAYRFADSARRVQGARHRFVVHITLDLLADLDGDAIGQAEMARQ